MTAPGLIAQTWVVLRKDLQIEFQRPARVTGIFFFALGLLLLVAAATPPSGVLRALAPGTLWIGLFLASTRSLDQSYTVETETGALEGLALWPADARALFYGKALANTAVLVAVAMALLPLLVAVFDAPVRGITLANLFGWPPGGEGGPYLAGVLAFAVLGSAAIAAPGTLYGLIAAEARGSSVLLPLLLFPLVFPALLCAAKGTTVLFEGDPMGDASAWFQMLAAFTALHWSLSGVLYRRILEDG
ncbi:MAG: heme exporter protein CcmB [Deltaproteobacteria bacterium]|nr:heme exporter protein CcmB [Deltaproteobacteria bacterium]